MPSASSSSLSPAPAFLGPLGPAQTPPDAATPRGALGGPGAPQRHQCSRGAAQICPGDGCSCPTLPWDPAWDHLPLLWDGGRDTLTVSPCPGARTDPTGTAPAAAAGVGLNRDDKSGQGSGAGAGRAPRRCGWAVPRSRVGQGGWQRSRRRQRWQEVAGARRCPGLSLGIGAGTGTPSGARHGDSHPPRLGQRGLRGHMAGRSRGLSGEPRLPPGGAGSQGSPPADGAPGCRARRGVWG